MIETTLMITLGAIALLLVLSAFFSGTETALTGSSRPLMHQLEQRGNRKAGLVNRLHGRQAHLIGTILIGNNLVNILASALATSALITAFGEAGIAYATLIMTPLVVMLRKFSPKLTPSRTRTRSPCGLRLSSGLLFFCSRLLPEQPLLLFGLR